MPLMLHAPARMSFERTLLARMGGGGAAMQAVPYADVGEDGGKRREAMSAYRVDSIYSRYGNVAVIKIHGVIDKVISQMEMDCYGGCDLQDIDTALALAGNDDRITHVVLDIHSPGGSVIGVKETAARIAALRDTKEVHAYIAGMACSAGYYLASQADIISAGESAIVGSIGVYIAILDASRWYADEGLSMQVLKAGEMKTMGAEWKPLTDDERAFLQASVNDSYADFKAAVTTLREVTDSTMQGQWFSGRQGFELKLVDNLTNATLDEYVTVLVA